MSAGEGQRPVGPVANEGERSVLVLAESVADVVDQHGVQGEQELAGRGIGKLACESAKTTLHHQHHHAGR